MNPQDLTKIKQLINTAPILSAPERAEWLVLLDLMDERQVGELQGILATGVKVGQKNKQSNQQADKQVSAQAIKQVSNQASKQVTVAPVKVPEKPKLAVPVAPAAKVPQMPNLSHIMNLPRVGEVDKRTSIQVDKGTSGQDDKQVSSQASKQLSGQADKPKGVSPQDLVRKLLGKIKPSQDLTKQNLFATKLKQTITEKELPAPKELLELPKPPLPKPKVVLPQVPVVQPKPPVILPKAVPLNTPPLLKPLPFAPKIAIPLKPLPNIPPTLKPLVKPLVLQKVGPAFKPGLNIEKASLKSTQDTLDNIKLHQAQKFSASEALPVIEQSIPLSSLKDLTMLTVKLLEEWDLEPLVKKIRSLIIQFGYFDVIFSIEKSEVYKIYIATGLKMLTAQIDFEQLAFKMQPGEFLERKDFEKFTDLLAKIQAS